jgi:pimeloyl-ACP methyl ester carboxylesterase
METKYIISSDGAKIAYSTFGCGPALLLVHGFGYDRNIFLDCGFVEILSKHFTVITPDIRGSGESDKSKDPGFYDIQNILNDLNLIVEKCGFSKYCYFGHSYGATIGLQACRSNNTIVKAVCAGSYFGDDFFKVSIPQWTHEYEEINAAKKNSNLWELNLSSKEREWAENNDLELSIAQFKAWNRWQGIDPKDIKTKLAVYSGTKDYEHILSHLYLQERDMLKYNIKFKIFEELNHSELVSKSDKVLPFIMEFLQS